MKLQAMIVLVLLTIPSMTLLFVGTSIKIVDQVQGPTLPVPNDPYKYIKSTRTGICFAKWSQGHGSLLASVPCTPEVLKAVKEDLND
jgi:hypothetical protein